MHASLSLQITKERFAIFLPTQQSPSIAYVALTTHSYDLLVVDQNANLHLCTFCTQQLRSGASSQPTKAQLYQDAIAKDNDNFIKQQEMTQDVRAQSQTGNSKDGKQNRADFLVRLGSFTCLTLNLKIGTVQELFARHDQHFDSLHQNIRGLGEMAKVMGEETDAQNEYVSK